MDWAAEVDQEERALEVLIGMTAKTLCRRSNAHLEQTLLLVEVSLGHANLHWKMLVEQHLSRKAAALAAVTAEAQKAVEKAEEAKKQAEAQHSQMQTSISTEAPRASQPAASATADPAQQAPVATTPQPGPASTPAQQKNASTAATTSASASGASAQAPAANAEPSGTAQADKETEVPELKQDENPQPVIQSLPEQLLKHLPKLLGQSGLSDLAQRRCASIIKMMVEMCPQLKPLMLAELQDELQRCVSASLDIVMTLAPCIQSATNIECSQRASHCGCGQQYAAVSLAMVNAFDVVRTL